MTKPNRIILAITVAVVAVVSLVIFSSWDFKQSSPFIYDDQSEICDTIPGKDKKVRDLDDVLRELDAAELNVDMDKIRREISEAMTKIDKEKIRMDVEKALREVDMQKIKMEIEQSLASIDMDKIRKEIESEMKNLDLDMEKMKAELSKIGPEIEKSLEKAKMEIEKAKAEIREYKDFVNDLDKDGLIDKEKGYLLEHKDGVLTIDGKKASQDVYSKYREFLDKHKKFRIKKTEDDFDLDLD